MIDGDTFGDDKTVHLNKDNAEAWAQSERDCTSDSLYARFRNHQYMNGSGDWVNWGDLDHNRSKTPQPYNYCPISNTAWDVKKTC